MAAEVPMAQHTLLMMWLVAWKQTPCGSLPADESTIRAKCKVTANIWAKCRELAMRGWWAADDGRLYHPTITARVLEMLEYRRKEAERRNRNRGTTPEVPPVSRGTPIVVHHESHETPDTGTGTNTSPPSVKKSRASAPTCPANVAESVWSDWLALRKAKKAPVTATVIASAEAEAAKAGMSFEAFLRVWCLRGTQGLQADWLKPSERAEPQWAKERRAEIAAYGGTPRKTAEIIDMEDANAAQSRLG
jgi:hypothetical protein